MCSDVTMMSEWKRKSYLSVSSSDRQTDGQRVQHVILHCTARNVSYNSMMDNDNTPVWQRSVTGYITYTKAYIISNSINSITSIQSINQTRIAKHFMTGLHPCPTNHLLAHKLFLNTINRTGTHIVLLTQCYLHVNHLLPPNPLQHIGIFQGNDSVHHRLWCTAFPLFLHHKVHWGGGVSQGCHTSCFGSELQSVPLATSPKPLSSKHSFGLVKIIQTEYILQYLLARIIEIIYSG